MDNRIPAISIVILLFAFTTKADNTWLYRQRAATMVAAITYPYAHYWVPSTLNENDLVGTLHATSEGFDPTTNGWDMGTATSKYVMLSGPISNPSSYSVTAWVNPNLTTMNTNTFGGWVVADRGATAGVIDYQLFYDNGKTYGTNGWVFAVFDVSGTRSWAINTNSYNGVWQHVAGVVDAVSNTVRVYVNGISGSPHTLGITPNNANTNKAVFGGSSWAPLGYPGTKFNGSIGRVRIYNRSVNASDLASEIAGDGGTGP